MSKHSRELREQRRRLLAPPASGFQVQAHATSFSGPLPPPEILAKYNEAIPNGAERIMALAENQSQHRQGLEKQVIASNCRAQTLGTILGFIICLAAIGSGTFLIYVGKSAQGLVPILGALVGLVTVFFYGKHKQEQQLRQRAGDLAPTTNQ